MFFPQTIPPPDDSPTLRITGISVNLSSCKTTQALGSACVTLIVCELAPSPETVIVAVRSPFDVLASATTEKDPFPEPDDGVIVSQFSDEVAVQLALLLTVTSLLPPSAL